MFILFSFDESLKNKVENKSFCTVSILNDNLSLLLLSECSVKKNSQFYLAATMRIDPDGFLFDFNEG